MQAPERRNFGASVVETMSIALAFSSTQLVFGFFPQLKDGWTYFPTLAVVIAVVWFPGSCLADRLRERKRS